VCSKLGTKAEAYGFRRRIYYWRRNVIDALVPPEAPAAAEAREWLEQLFGKRVTKEWLDLTYFKVVSEETGYANASPIGYANAPGSGRYLVEAGVTAPMFGPDIVFGDLVNLEVERRVIEEARRSPIRPQSMPAPIGEALAALEVYSDSDIEALSRELFIPPEALRVEASLLRGESRAVILATLREKFK
jgi:hypothetical protein